MHAAMLMHSVAAWMALVHWHTHNEHILFGKCLSWSRTLAIVPLCVARAYVFEEALVMLVSMLFVTLMA